MEVEEEVIEGVLVDGEEVEVVIQGMQMILKAQIWMSLLRMRGAVLSVSD
jgi:hypothetical protein